METIDVCPNLARGVYIFKKLTLPTQTITRKSGDRITLISIFFKKPPIDSVYGRGNLVFLRDFVGSKRSFQIFVIFFVQFYLQSV